MRRMAACLLMFSTLAGCTSKPVQTVAEPAPVAAACPVEKLAFTQATGCRNDGSLEFCVPKDDAALVQRLRAVVPELRASEGGGGRARCDTSHEALYFLDTRPAYECVSDSGRLTDAAWEKLCRIAAEPRIRRIVPTWYE